MVEPLELHLYSKDASLMRGKPTAVVFPQNTEQVAEVVQIAERTGTPIVARGAGTGLAAGASPTEGGIVVVTTAIQDVDIDPNNRTAWVGAVVINLDLSHAAAPYGLYFAPDPSSQQACTIGGNVANNSGGPHCLAEGSTTSHVLAVSVTVPVARYSKPPLRADFYSRAFAALEGLTEVEHAGIGVVMPLTGNNWTSPFERVDRPAPPGERPPEVGWQAATGGYFTALGIPLVAGRLFDVYVMLVFGIVGFVLRRYGYPMAPLVLGLVLGDLLEKNLRRALVLSDGDLTPFFTRPISAVVAALIFGTIGWKLYSLHRARRVTHAPSTGVT